MKACFGVSRLQEMKYQMPSQWMRILVLAASALFSISSAPGHAALVPPAPFIMAADGDQNTYAGRLTILIFTEVFKRLGLPFQFDFYSLKRRSSMADEGGVDGEASRIYSYGATHPNLVRVEESVVDFNFALYTANPTLSLQRLEDLPATNFLVEYRRGILMCENTLKPLVSIDRLSDVLGGVQGVKKLLAGRTDLYCDIEIFVREQLLSPEIKGAERIRKVIDLGKSVPTYPYIHKRHAELAPHMAAVIKKMKAEGLIEAYSLQVERELGIKK